MWTHKYLRTREFLTHGSESPGGWNPHRSRYSILNLKYLWVRIRVTHECTRALPYIHLKSYPTDWHLLGWEVNKTPHGEGISASSADDMPELEEVSLSDNKSKRISAILTDDIVMLWYQENIYLNYGS